MKIEVWADLVCPFSYLGRVQFQKALKQFRHRKQIELIWRSFELDPDAPSPVQADMVAAMMARYNQSRVQIHELIDKLQAMAKAAGIPLKLEQALPARSFTAHRLVYFAAQYGLQSQAIDQLMRAHFVKGLDLNTPEVLIQELSQIGLDAKALEDAYLNEAFHHDVSADQHEAWNMGVSRTPYFLIDQQFAFAGALPTDIFLQILQDAWAGQFTGMKI